MTTLDLPGIITRVCSDLKGKFSRVSASAVYTSGTLIGHVTIDGTENVKFYMPTPPTASTTTPSMDGTASYGSGTSYARSNHVHPTDTSRQAALVSGTNIKTINSTSLLGSGNIAIAGLPSVTSSDNGKMLVVVNGAWTAATVPNVTITQSGSNLSIS